MVEPLWAFMQNNILNTTNGKAGDVLTATTKPGNFGKKKVKEFAIEISESVTEYRNQNGELVITATGVGVQTERAVDS